MKISGITPRLGSVAEVISTLQPDYPVHCLNRSRLQQAARQFLDDFPGDTLYAVKCNAHPIVLQELNRAGISHYDVASDHEINLVNAYCPGATLYYHHPAKTASSIKWAYDKAHVRYFAVDCIEELKKVLANTGTTAKITVRMAVPQDNSVYDLSTKFGAPPALAKDLIAYAADQGRKVGITFHVGSQCLHPVAYGNAMRIAMYVSQQTGVEFAFLDIGGGFPGYYQTTTAPPWSDYFSAIKAASDDLLAGTSTKLLCEPGRALVYAAGSLLTQVVLRNEDKVYINDGIFGGLAEVYWGGDALHLPVTVHRPGGTVDERLKPLTVYGPTCDGNDVLPYTVNLPVDLQDNDWIEFANVGAYGREMATSYNGLKSEELVIIEDFITA
ncbi:MAG: type III PLP-dependent enzyme [Magnetovibrio sp.]|nr:type III PLP-dependent enzyme [Magnetovibrio sp.]